MLITGILLGAVLATVVGVVFLGMGLATVGNAEEIIEAPGSTDSAEPTESPKATGDAGSTDAADPSGQGEASTDPQATDTTTTSNSPAGGVGVPEPCVISAEYNVTIDVQVDELAAGARDEDARTIQEALDAIQTARVDAEGAAEECLDLAGRAAP